MLTNYYRLILLALFFCFFYLPQKGYSQEKHQPHIFDSHELLKIKLEADIHAILADRGDNPSYHEAKLSFKGHDKKKVVLNVKLRSRGNFRKHPGNCIFPPLRVRFDEVEADPTIFHDNKKLKLVTHCQEEESIIREYLIYRTLNLLTPYSFKVRLAKITYKDTEKQYPLESWYAFFIEDGDDVARRNGGNEMSEDGHHQEAVEQEALGMMYLFNAMVGNTDWDLTLAKNLKFIQFRGEQMPIAIPYDFDWCAAVKASYTRMDSDDYERMRYRPFCSSTVDFPKLIQHFKDKKPEIIDLYMNSTHLAKVYARETLAYFEEFYQEIEKESFIQEKLLKDCDK